MVSAAPASPLKIIIAPDPVLKATAAPIARVDDDVRRLVDAMFTTMYQARGVGLAAPQVAISRRILVMDPVRGEPAPAEAGGIAAAPIAMINPEIIWRSDEPNVFEEGCLSLPEFFVEIERPASVRVKYMDLQNTEHELLAEGFLATVLQHELDHLNGVLLLDYISKLKRDMQIKRLIKLKKEDEVL